MDDKFLEIALKTEEAILKRRVKEAQELEKKWILKLSELMNWDYEKLVPSLNSEETLDSLFFNLSCADEYIREIKLYVDLIDEDPEFMKDLLKDIVPY